MANRTNIAHRSRFVAHHTNPGSTFYAVYDCCITNNVPSRDVAFIEQRLGKGYNYEQVASNEVYFRSLREAKTYVNGHFQSGAEYFSLKQCADPDNILLTIIDKITYLMA